jgi:hypothetical protein
VRIFAPHVNGGLAEKQIENTAYTDSGFHHQLLIFFNQYLHRNMAVYTHFPQRPPQQERHLLSFQRKLDAWLAIYCDKY